MTEQQLAFFENNSDQGGVVQILCAEIRRLQAELTQTKNHWVDDYLGFETQPPENIRLGEGIKPPEAPQSTDGGLGLCDACEMYGKVGHFVLWNDSPMFVCKHCRAKLLEAL